MDNARREDLNQAARVRKNQAKRRQSTPEPEPIGAVTKLTIEKRLKFIERSIGKESDAYKNLLAQSTAAEGG